MATPRPPSSLTEVLDLHLTYVDVQIVPHSTTKAATAFIGRQILCDNP